MTTYAQLDSIAEQVQKGENPRHSVRNILSWFGVERRGVRVVAEIRRQLRSRKLETRPDFTDAWIDAEVAFARKEAKETPLAGTPGEATPVAAEAKATASAPGAPTSAPDISQAPKLFDDPVQRIGKMSAANQPVTTVTAGTPIAQAVTLMLLKDFSQLPVMQNAVNCKGAVTWQSLARRTYLGAPAQTVDDCLAPVYDVRSDDGLLAAIPRIVESGFVLVRAPDRKLQGIVTTADLSEQFRALTEPFLLLAQIENYVRLLIARSFSLEELKQAKNPSDTSREISDASDLSFGEYVHLLEPAAAWAKLELRIDRKPFMEDLKAIHSIRNDVMHFDPDGVAERELSTMRGFARFLDMLGLRP